MVVDPLGSVDIEPGAISAKGSSLFVSAEKNTKNKGSARDVAGEAGVSKEDIE